MKTGPSRGNAPSAPPHSTEQGCRVEACDPPCRMYQEADAVSVTSSQAYGQSPGPQGRSRSRTQVRPLFRCIRKSLRPPRPKDARPSRRNPTRAHSRPPLIPTGRHERHDGRGPIPEPSKRESEAQERARCEGEQAQADPRAIGQGGGGCEACDARVLLQTWRQCWR